MQPFSLELEEASIVLVGSLNPAIFHPEWLLRHGLISQDDLEGAKTEIVHRDISQFSLNWLKFEVRRDRLIVRTNDPSQYGPLNDLIISILKILEHIPIDKMGMNLSITYKIETEDLWHKVGDKLAPKNYWDVLPKRVGLKSLNVQCPRQDDLKGYINVGVGSVKSDFFGVAFSVNSHVDLKYVEDDNEIVQDASVILSDHWESILKFAKESCENILLKAIEG